MKLSKKCAQDLLKGKAVYIKPGNKAGEGTLSFNGIRFENCQVSFLVKNKIIAFIKIPKGIDFSNGDTVTITIEGEMTIKLIY